jgi:predicted ATPase
VNSFLTDSSKRLEFNRALGKLVFKVLDKNDTVVGDDRDISNLSSGEKQIVILFTYLKFHEESSTVFIIDEPELSLHPRWQEEFLNSVKILMPKKTQLVIATHSPIIVGPNKKYCKVLLPYNE